MLSLEPAKNEFEDSLTITGPIQPHAFLDCSKLQKFDLRLITSVYPYKRWGSVAELTCHLQGSTRYGIRFSHETYRPSPTKDVT
jgi:hypothetical protein